MHATMLLQFSLVVKFAGSSVKESVRCMMSRLCTNQVMSFLSMSGRNMGKLAFATTNLCDLVVGMHTTRLLSCVKLML